MTASGRTTDVRAVPENVSLLIPLSFAADWLLPKVTDSRLVHLLNALASATSSESGSATEVSALQ